MSFIVEDGSGIANANAFCSVDFANNYHADRGNTAWESVDNVEAAIVKATDFMEQQYRRRWKGYRKTSTQALSWPRDYVYLEPFTRGADGAYPYLMANNIVPEQVKQACAELALRSVSADLAPDTERGIKSQTVGPITTVYDTADPQGTSYRAVNGILSSLLGGSSSNVELVVT